MTGSLFVATLGYSRRTYVTFFLHERQSAWLQGLEGAFRHFAGLTRELLIDNAKALHSHVITIRGDSYRLRTKRRAGLVNQASATEAKSTE